MTAPEICRIYQGVSTLGRDRTRQQQLVANAEAAGFYLAGVYSEKIKGTVIIRPELNRLIADLKAGDVVIAESLDRISHLPVAEGEAPIDHITEKGAKISVPDLIDLWAILASSTEPLVQIILEANQPMVLKIALPVAQKDYECGPRNRPVVSHASRRKTLLRHWPSARSKARRLTQWPNAKIVELRGLGYTLAK